VTVDLKDLVFADLSLMVDLAMLSRRLRRHGKALLLREAQPQVVVQIKKVGLHRLPGVQVDGSWPSLA
jgi:anti-anti-sigma regulatory factor